ncbi:MAG: alpha/beta fold hydrolase [Solirubrobacterales bacterium]
MRSSVQGHRLRKLEESFASLPARYVGSETPLRATAEVELVDLARSWRVDLRQSECQVRELDTGNRLRADVVISTDSGTWLALRAGKLTGLEAFGERRLRMRGNLSLATAFESMFSLPDGGAAPQRVRLVKAGSQRISTLTTGDGPEHVLLLHGLGADKASFFTTINALASSHTVHAIDFPGFGASSKPASAPYNAPWLANRVRDLLDELGIEKVHLVGNSMGGRIAIELGLRDPGRVASLSLLAPAMAWRRRRAFLPIVRLLRPELAFMPHPILAPLVREQVKDLFADPQDIDPDLIEITAQEFCRQYRSRNARIAFYAAARNIYLDEPFGEAGMWTRLCDLKPPTLFVFGDRDKLVPAGFSPHCEQALPNGRCVVLEDCGHVPQIERPERTNALIRSHIASNLGSSVRRWVTRAAS